MNNELIIPEKKKITKGSIGRIGLLILAIIILITVISPIFSNQETYKYQYEYLDEKLGNVTALSLGSTSVAFVLTWLPDDVGTPIANELAELSGYLLLVMSAIFLERFLMTTIGFVACTIILPASFIFEIISILTQPESKMRFKELAFRLFVFGLCIMFVIPLGCTCGRAIEKANSQSIETALNDAKNANEIVESIPKEEQNKNIFERVGDFFSSLWGNATAAIDWAKKVINNFMLSISVMLVTTIAIPILMFLSFIWLIRFLTKRDFTKEVLGFVNGFAQNTKKRIMEISKTIRDK